MKRGECVPWNVSEQRWFSAPRFRAAKWKARVPKEGR